MTLHGLPHSPALVRLQSPAVTDSQVSTSGQDGAALAAGAGESAWACGPALSRCPGARCVRVKDNAGRLLRGTEGPWAWGWGVTLCVCGRPSMVAAQSWLGQF